MNIRDIIKEFLQGDVTGMKTRDADRLTEAPVDAKDAMARYIDDTYGPAARVGSDEWKAAEAERQKMAAADAQTAVQPLPKEQLDAQTKRVEDLMRRHDWYYGYSDDHRVWAAGNKSQGSIDSLLSQLRKRGHAEEVDALLKKYDPKKR